MKVLVDWCVYILAGINNELIYAGALKDTARLGWVIWMVVDGAGTRYR